jgi:hypothetical protein
VKFRNALRQEVELDMYFDRKCSRTRKAMELINSLRRFEDFYASLASVMRKIRWNLE